jgi:hypothetical protein
MFTKSWFGSWITDGDEGFSVRYGRDFAVYREGHRQLTLSIDVGGNGAIIIVGSGARWDDDPGKSIDTATQMEIIGRVKKALEWSAYK